MDPRTRRLGWGWWALAFVALAGGVYAGYTVIEARKAAAAAQAVFDSRAEKIDVGMTERQVRGIMGTPNVRDEWFDWGDRDLCRYWQQGASRLAVKFDPKTRNVVRVSRRTTRGSYACWLDEEPPPY